MICGRLTDFEALGLELLGSAARGAVEWIRALPVDAGEGSFELDGGLRALVLRYPTTAEAASPFETHRRFVDFQYTLAGTELLEWIPRESLRADGGYDQQKDLCLYHAGPPAGRLVAGPGVFSIFTPLDAHRGGIRPHDHGTEVRKLVVKIPVGSFAAVIAP